MLGLAKLELDVIHSVQTVFIQIEMMPNRNLVFLLVALIIVLLLVVYSIWNRNKLLEEKTASYEKLLDKYVLETRNREKVVFTPTPPEVSQGSLLLLLLKI